MAVPKDVDGFSFDSSTEAARYAELKLRAKARLIRDLRLHPCYALTIPSPSGRGGFVASNFTLDFGYYDVATGRRVLEDVKGYKGYEHMFNLKARILLFLNPGLTLYVVERRGVKWVETEFKLRNLKDGTRPGEAVNV